MASRTVARQEHGGKARQVLGIDYDALHRESIAIKERAERERAAVGFTATEYGRRFGRSRDWAREELRRLERAGKIERAAVWRGNNQYSGWIVRDNK